MQMDIMEKALKKASAMFSRRHQADFQQQHFLEHQPRDYCPCPPAMERQTIHRLGGLQKLPGDIPSPVNSGMEAAGPVKPDPTGAPVSYSPKCPPR